MQGYPREFLLSAYKSLAEKLEHVLLSYIVRLVCGSVSEDFEIEAWLSPQSSLLKWTQIDDGEYDKDSTFLSTPMVLNILKLIHERILICQMSNKR